MDYALSVLRHDNHLSLIETKNSKLVWNKNLHSQLSMKLQCCKSALI